MKKLLIILLITSFYGLSNSVFALRVAEPGTVNSTQTSDNGGEEYDTPEEDNYGIEGSGNNDLEQKTDLEQKDDLEQDTGNDSPQLYNNGGELYNQELKERQKAKEELKRKNEELRKEKDEELKNRLDSISAGKLEIVSSRIDAAIEKVENSSKLSQEKKDNLLSQLVALNVIIDEQLGVSSEENDLLNELFN